MSDFGLLPIIQVRAGVAGVADGESAIGGGVLFRENLDGAEMRAEAGACEFIALLLGIAFGDQQTAVARGQLGQGCSHAGQRLDLVLGDGLDEAQNACVFLRGDGGVRQLLEAGHQRAAEALEAVAVRSNRRVLNAVQVGAHLLGSVGAVVEVGDERRNRALEINIVLPQCVVGVEQQGLAGRLARLAGELSFGSGVCGHRWIICL